MVAGVGGGYNNNLNAVTLDSSGGIVVTGMTGPTRKLYLARLIDETASLEPSIEWPNALEVVDARMETEAMIVRLRSKRGGWVAIDVVDMLGRSVGRWSNVETGMGESQVRVRCGRLTPGNYIVRARGGSGVAAARVVVAP